MLSTPLICASIGAATESASVFESAPGYVADTVTCTGVIVGYCCTGSAVIDTRPASTMMIATTAAKIGRSMKKCENMRFAAAVLPDGGDVDAARVGVAAVAGHLRGRLQPERRSRNPGLDERIAHRQRPTFREFDVRVDTAGLVGVPGDDDRRRQTLEAFRRIRDDLSRPRRRASPCRLRNGPPLLPAPRLRWAAMARGYRTSPSSGQRRVWP